MITGPITYRLSRPVTSIDREVVELTLREPTGLDMRSCGDQADAGFTHRLIARLAASRRPPSTPWRARRDRAGEDHQPRFFGDVRPADVVDRYYECARWWGGAIGNVFELTSSELSQALLQAQRIATLERNARGNR